MKRAIVIAFEGLEPSAEVITRMTSILKDVCDAESSIDVYHFSPTEIVKMLIQSSMKNVDIKCDEDREEDQAIIYLGTIFKEQLAAPYNTTALMTAILNKIAEAKQAPNSPESKRLINALFILTRDSITVSKQLMDRYNFSTKKLEFIKTLYNSVSKF